MSEEGKYHWKQCPDGKSEMGFFSNLLDMEDFAQKTESHRCHYCNEMFKKYKEQKK